MKKSNFYGFSAKLAVFIVMTIFIVSLFSSLSFAAKDFSITSLTDKLYLTGTEVIIDEAKSRDLTIAANSVYISAPISGNINIAAGEVTIDSVISGDVKINAAKILLTETAIISGEVSFDSDEVIIEGTIEGNAKIDAIDLELSETAQITGDLTTSTEPSRSNKILGTLVLLQKAEQDLNKKITTENSTFIQNLLRAVVLFIIGSLLLFFFSSHTESVVQKMVNGPIINFAFGLLFFILAPILAILLTFTVIGIPLALFIVITVSLLIALSVVYISLSIGYLILNKILNLNTNSYLELVVGIVIFLSLIKLPVIGPILAVYGICAGLGSGITSLVWHSPKRRIKQL